MTTKAKAAAFVAEINADELALRLMQIAIGLKAPPGTDASAALDEHERVWMSADAGPFPFRRMAHASIAYFGECIDRGRVPS